MDFFYLVALILSSSFFSISEISLAAAKRIRLQTLADEGNSRATAVLRLQENPGQFFTVVQIGVNAVALAGGILGERFFTPAFTSWAELIVSNHSVANTIGFWTAFSFSTILFILFADLIPKRVGLIAPETIALFIVRPMSFLIKLFAPFILIFNGIASFFIRTLGLPSQSTNQITSEDIIATVDAGTAAGVIASEEQAAIENIFELESRTVPSAMTPRESICFLLLDDSEDEIRQKLIDTSHSKYLVCDNDLDHVVGIVDSKHLLNRLLNHQKLCLKEKGLVQHIPMIPDSLTLSESLDCFKKANSDLLVIINEYALVVGILSLNDVMSTVMGDLVSNEEEAQIIEREDGSWLVDGATPVDDLLHVLELDQLPADSTYETVAGFMMYMLRKIPKRTDRTTYAGFRFEVIDVDSNKVDQVLVTRLKQNPPVSEIDSQPSEN